MENFTPIHSPEHTLAINEAGVIVGSTHGGFGIPFQTDVIYPYIILSLCTSGTAHTMYDMKEMRTVKNDLSFIIPGHIQRAISCSEDFSQAWLLFDPAKFTDSELTFNKKDVELINQAPVCHLSDEQASSLITIGKMIDYIATRSEKEIANKHRLLESQLTIAYELYLSIRHQQDLQWINERMGKTYLEFCNLVVEHHKTERNVCFYSKQLGYDPRYFTKIFKAYNNGISPLDWIGNYVATRAKQLINDDPNISIKAVSIRLGFPVSANFCRYFKRVTGIYPQTYKDEVRKRLIESGVEIPEKDKRKKRKDRGAQRRKHYETIGNKKSDR